MRLQAKMEGGTATLSAKIWCQMVEVCMAADALRNPSTLRLSKSLDALRQSSYKKGKEK